MLSNKKTMRTLFILSIVLGILFISLSKVYAYDDYDIIIRNGKVLDGVGSK
jgi:hypothetical protein